MFPMYTLRVESIVGQRRAIDSLLRATEGGRRHHAWIFSGPFGVGKYTTAIEFAKTLLCEGSFTGDTNPDLHVIKKEDVVWSNNPALKRRKQTNIPLDLLRERMIGGVTSDGKQHDALVYKTAVRSKEKVFIIDEAELLDEAGQNALLKTLEEPPLGTTVILVTSREDLLLPTIVSRCNDVPFAPLSDDEMRNWVSDLDFKCSPSELSWAVSFSSGSPGLLIESVDSGLPVLAEELADFLLCKKNQSYVDVSATLISFVESNVTRWTKENPNASKESANRRAVNLVLLLFGSAARSHIRGGVNMDSVNVSPDGVVGISLAGLLVDIERELSTNISVKVLLESLAARWSSLSVGDAVFMQ